MRNTFFHLFWKPAFDLVWLPKTSDDFFYCLISRDPPLTCYVGIMTTAQNVTIIPSLQIKLCCPCSTIYLLLKKFYFGFSSIFSSLVSSFHALFLIVKPQKLNYYQKYSRLRCFLHVKGLVICFYLGWSGSTLLITKHIIKVGSKS